MPARCALRRRATRCAEAFRASQAAASPAYPSLVPQSYPAPPAPAAGLGGALSRLALHDDGAAAAASYGGLAAPLSPMRRGALPPPPLLKGPSGPRRAGEGVEEEEQAVVAVEKLANGGLQARSSRTRFIAFRLALLVFRS